uniref:Uncharacterized protein n=1 Tax=Heterorhabditis bacteriophora TaxID=37862 RepID=A0A1I7WLG6_HETBA
MIKAVPFSLLLLVIVFLSSEADLQVKRAINPFLDSMGKRAVNPFLDSIGKRNGDYRRLIYHNYNKREHQPTKKSRNGKFKILKNPRSRERATKLTILE